MANDCVTCRLLTRRTLLPTPALSLTGRGPALSLTGRGPAVSLTGGGPAVSLTGGGPAVSLTGGGPALSLTGRGPAVSLTGRGLLTPVGGRRVSTLCQSPLSGIVGSFLQTLRIVSRERRLRRLRTGTARRSNYQLVTEVCAHARGSWGGGGGGGGGLSLPLLISPKCLVSVLLSHSSCGIPWGRLIN